MDQKGFTLIEVLVVIVIISIGFMSVTTSIGIVEEVRFQKVVKEVKQSIEYAQSCASMQNKNYVVAKKLQGNQQVIEVKSGAKQIYKIDIPQTIEVKINKEPINVGGKSIAFNGDLSPSQAGTISLTHKKNKKRVDISVRPVTGEIACYEETYQ